MDWNKQLGQIGEEKAVLFLQKKGMQILETNWRYQHKELDIIAMDGKILVFIEVKTRSDNNFGEPEEAVDTKKEAFMASAGAAYMRQIKHNWEIRFDVISIIYKNEQNFDLNYFKDAFFPQWKF